MTKRSYLGLIQKNPTHLLVFITFSVAMLLLFSGMDTFAVTTDSLRDPISKFKTEAFDWGMMIKIISVVAGSAVAAVTSSIKPLGGGVAVAAGLSFFENYINVTSALIG
jgi:hypothetical protein